MHDLYVIYREKLAADVTAIHPHRWLLREAHGPLILRILLSRGVTREIFRLESKCKTQSRTVSRKPFRRLYLRSVRPSARSIA